MSEGPSWDLPGVVIPYSPQRFGQHELRDKALRAADMLAFALQQVQAALTVANNARVALDVMPTAEELAGALTVGDLKIRAALCHVQTYGREAVHATRAVFGEAEDGAEEQT